MKAVIVLKDTVAKHDQLIEAIADKLDQIYIRLDRLEALIQQTASGARSNEHVEAQGWPPDVEKISMENLERLGIDGKDRLFWNGREIEVKSRLDLTGVQKIFAVVVALMAVLGGLGGFATGFNDLSEFLCARNDHLLSCPAPQPAILSSKQAQRTE